MNTNWLHSTRIHFDENATGTGASPAPAPSGGDAPASSPSPSPSPSPAPSEPSSSPAGGNEPFTLPEFGEELDDGDDSVTVDPTVPGAVTPPPAAPTAAPPQTPAPAAPQPQAPVPPVPAPAEAPPSVPVAQDRPLDPTNPAEIASALRANAADMVTGLAQSTYVLSPEDVEGLETNAVGVIPGLLAKVHVNVMTAVMNQMANIVPHVISRHTQVVQRNSENANAFFDTNKHLDRSNPAVAEAVSQLARVYRAQNPKATKADMIRDVGIMASHRLGIAIPAPGQPAAARSAPAGFVPAATSGGGLPPPAPVADPWAAMGQDFEE